ncbi:hypothetical protein F5Y16DRAFT_424734 [Xylariaceae sp. FL0255]|nr:hypothetical protein F5Y16DRAFT_424734 [Xylariaceae sp. FL0255]
MPPSKSLFVNRYPSITNYTWAHEFAYDKDQPVSLGCFESAAKKFESDQISYHGFLDAALSHITRDIRHPEDSDLTNLANLSKCGPMGPVAAAIKLCMLCDDLGFSKEVVDVLRLLEPTSSIDLLQSVLPTNLPPLQLQIVVIAALQRGLPGFATDILLAGPEPPKRSLFNLFGCELCPCLFPQYYDRVPPTFWVSALKARWLVPSPGLASNAVHIGPSGGSVVRALLDDPTLDITLKHDDPSLLRDILARLPADEKLEPELLRLALSDRKHGGAQVLALLLDYRDGNGSRDRDRWYEDSMTPLHRAAANRNQDAVRFLISRGADVNESDGYDRTARDLALKAGHKRVARMLGEAAKKDPDKGRCVTM